jgi:hypothetical protein
MMGICPRAVRNDYTQARRPKLLHSLSLSIPRHRTLFTSTHYVTDIYNTSVKLAGSFIVETTAVAPELFARRDRLIRRSARERADIILCRGRVLRKNCSKADSWETAVNYRAAESTFPTENRCPWTV